MDIYYRTISDDLNFYLTSELRNERDVKNHKRLGGIPSLKYFARVIQLLENSGINAKIEPPTQTE